MKILLSLLGAITLTASSVAFASSNIFVGHRQRQNLILNQENNESENENNQIDWKMLNKNTSNYFDNLKQENAFSINDVDSEKIISVLDFAQQKANGYIKQFQEQNLSLDQIINILSKESPEFGKNYQEQLDQPVKSDDTVHATSMISAFSSSEVSVAFLDKKSKDLKIARTVFITVSATSAVAVAGFWAAAWWFGISVPWALAATLVSAITGTVAGGLGIALVKYDKELTDWKKATLATPSTITLGISFYKILKPLIPLLTGAEVTITANSWKIPTALAVLPIISTTLAFIDLLK